MRVLFKTVVAQRTIGCFTLSEMCYLNGIQMCLSFWPTILDKPPNIVPVLIEPPLAWAKDWWKIPAKSAGWCCQCGAANRLFESSLSWCDSVHIHEALMAGRWIFLTRPKEGWGFMTMKNCRSRNQEYRVQVFKDVHRMCVSWLCCSMFLSQKMELSNWRGF